MWSVFVISVFYVSVDLLLLVLSMLFSVGTTNDGRLMIPFRVILTVEMSQEE